jgi:hypothetical protein
MSTDFKIALSQELSNIQNNLGLDESKAFLYWFATQILEMEDDSALEAISVEGSNDKGIDLFYVDDEDGRVFIAQGKHSPKFTYQAKENDVANLESSLNWLSTPEALEREGKPDLAQAASDYLEAQKDGFGVELLYVYTGPKSTNVEKKIAVYNQNEENIEKKRCMRHYHVGLLRDLWAEIQGERKRIKRAKLRILGGGLPVSGKFGKALIATVPCKEIVRLYRRHEDTLFDRNVRLFLGARKGSINAGIGTTIRDPVDRGNFWAYNNGITIICDKFEEKKGEVTLINFSIVNGCQTTVSLAENNGESDDLSVLVRFVAASAQIVDDVIRYTNSQNPIRTWDIASQDKTQRRLKSEFDKLRKPFIYLTRRGDHPLRNLRKYRINGRIRQIKIDLLGQYMAAFRGNPVLAYKHKAFIFSRFHEDVFPMDVRVEEALFCWICGQICREVVCELIIKEEEKARILKKGGTLFTLAAMAEIARKYNGSSYLATISEDQITSNAGRLRMRKYAELAAMLYVQAVQDEARIKKEELTTLIRQKEFADSVLARIRSQFDILATNKGWLKGLPKLR